MGFLLAGSFTPVFAQEQPTPAATPSSQEIELGAPTPTGQEAPETGVTLSSPKVPSVEPSPGAAGNAKPSQGEGEKAPVTSRPTAVPEFSLPEVVITGQNELTIAAQRLGRQENEVTLGSHDLTGVERSINDLPGLSKTFTALATEEAGPGKDTALVLHLGGGTPDTYGGWGLFGQEFKDFQYLLSGFDSNWGGESVPGPGHDGDKRYGFGGQLDLSPTGPMNLSLTGDFKRVDAEMPYQASQRETHDGLHFGLADQWKISGVAQAELEITEDSTLLHYLDAAPENHQGQEWEGNFRFTADPLGSFFNRFSAELGGRHAASDFSAPAATGYDWGWLTLQGFFKSGENLNLTAKVQAQGGGGLNLPLKLYPALNFMWRVFGNSQLNLYWLSDRGVDGFGKTFADMEHTAPLAGFPDPTEVADEWGGRFTQKLSEQLLVSVSASTAQINGYHQWTDINALAPVFIQDYSTVGQVQMNKVGANVQWNFRKDWQLAATYQWTQGQIQSPDAANLTNLPTHRGVLSLYRGDDTLETRLELQLASERQEFADLPGTLPAYATLSLDAAWHLSKTFSLWLNGDNLLGLNYQVQPGYPEPQYHVRGGVEVIF